ncbi:MAG: tripartite tricarboxylate transporter substrate binding protein [Rhodospirillaceae bacterium]
MKKNGISLAAALALAAAGSALAQVKSDYPARPVRVVVGFPAGGPSDILARLVAQKLGEATGQQFIVDNRGGASGMIGAEMVAKAAADGYTLLVVPATHAVNPSLYRKVPFDTMRDFTPVSLVAEGPFILVVHPSLPARSVQELVALARRRPGELNYASAGVGGLPHLAGELFKSTTAIRMNHIPYKGAAPATIDLVAGHVTIMFNNMLSAVPHVKGGRLRALGVTTVKRSSAVPEVPTIAEAGVKGYEVSGWYGLLGPASLPADVLNRLNAEVNRAMRQPDVVKRLAGEGVDAMGSTSDEFAARIRREMTKWAAVVKASGATAE